MLHTQNLEIKWFGYDIHVTGHGCVMPSLAKLAKYFRKKTNSYPIYESCVCSLNRLATVSLCPNPQLRRRVYLRCRLGAALSPRGSVALSLFPLFLSVSVSFAFCLFRATHSIAKRVQQYQQQRRQHHQQQQQQQLTQIILVEFRNFYFNSVISKKYTQHRQRYGRDKCDFECVNPGSVTIFNQQMDFQWAYCTWQGDRPFAQSRRERQRRTKQNRKSIFSTAITITILRRIVPEEIAVAV